MKNKNVRGIIALAVVTALSFGVIMGSKALAKDMGTGASNTAEEQVKEEIDTKGAEGIEKAVKTENGYMVTAKVKGYGGDIVMNVSFDAEKKKVTKVEVTEQKETEGLGAKVADAEFLSQFEGVEAPVFLPGMSLEKEEKVSDEELLKELKDGTYEAKADAPDNNGFTDVVTVTVKDGKIAEVNWEAVGADGSTKSVLSENGEYVMTEDGLTWKEQAEALAKAVVENQSLSFLNLDEQGKTDAVSGVSISIGGFTALAEKCLKEAAGITQTLELKDGTYEAKAEAADNNGFIDQVTMTVADGKIAEVNWEAVGADGSTKSVLSENGEYVMTEDGLTWKEQAEALAKAVVENQSLSFLNLDEQGKTDAVSGVSISIGGFTALAEKCLKEAAGITQTLELKDGTYEAKAEAADNNGFIDQVTMTVADGKITEVNWEAVGEDGSKKSVLSENGEYVMTEDGLTWKEQAEALASALIENQSLDFLQVNEQGKTDAVSGVSISVGGFISLAEKCMNEAAGVEEKEEVPANGTQVDAVSGATISSTAVVTGINTAFEFLQAVK